MQLAKFNSRRVSVRVSNIASWGPYHLVRKVIGNEKLPQTQVLGGINEHGRSAAVELS